MVLLDGRIQTWVEERGQRAVLTLLQQKCKTRIGDEGTHLARTENLWVRAVIARIDWDQVVGVFNTRLRGRNCILKHGASTEALEHELPG